MKLLWITNTLFPEISREMGGEISVINGWVSSSAKSLLEHEKSIELAVATPYNEKSLVSRKINNITYFLFPKSKNLIRFQNTKNNHWQSIKDEFNPDLIHIHGTEYTHGLNYINSCGNKGVVISIQGLVSVIDRFFFGGIDPKTVLRNITLRDRKSVV